MKIREASAASSKDARFAPISHLPIDREARPIAPTTQAAHGLTSRAKESVTRPIFPPLEDVSRPVVSTKQAAFYLLRRPQTLRGWACNEDGPIRPIRIGSRLGWPVAQIRAVLGVAQ